ncbi:ATP-binding cassette domain-containing protein [Paenibacillus oenotherae]|uniref:ATP-binding cassette domain-containing protein n=1 Tax=Paenibacillus oenotherae TaxID=1435645 RepID=A0ABS7D6J9_9BACL|nr:ATP-binding cassette domain-containing protein [Paenibacillus oenotherae]MBW7474788.1 ATP-binding cassette domain-containing protein [Paenibacillus oenotherae]
MHTVTVEGLNKTYRSVPALSNIHLELGTGLFGLLGPNGAGKTTLMKILSTVLPYEEGRVTIYDLDLAKEGEKVRGLLGYLPQHFYVPLQFTGRELLHYVGSMKGLTDQRQRTSQVERLLEEVNLLPHADKKIKSFSGGMTRRLGIAQALLGDPKFIILDEPTAGLDPSERIRFRNVIEKLGNDYTIILSTHIISDIETSCEKVAVLNKGSVRYQGTTVNLAKRAAGCIWELQVPYAEYDHYAKEYTVIASRREMNHAVFRVIAQEPPHLQAVAVQPTIEDGYMAVINGVTG